MLRRWSIALASALTLAALDAQAAPPKPSLTPDKEGFCQRTDFVAWSKDGVEAAWSDSYCRQPPPDAAYDTLYLVGRDGRIRRWLIGAEAGATMKLETRAKLLYGESYRKEGAKSPDGALEAKARVEGEYLIVTFAAKKKDAKAPPPVTREVKLPYAKWPDTKAPKASEIYWSPDGGALAIVVRGEKKEPAGGKLPVGAVFFHELRSLPAKAK